jgi:hypothetical protein
MKKIINNNTTFLLLLLATCVAGCSKEDESPFAGNDNYIAAFTLVKDGVTLNGAVSPEAIVITAPEQFSLAGATATVTLSENATIAPDPATIADWNEEQTFTVTAYTGATHVYTYRVERHIVSRDGDVVLLTQADVNAFVAELDADQINGALTIGAATGQDSVYALTGLERLKVITGGLVVNATCAGTDLTAFENLETTGELVIRSKKVKTVRFPKLTALRAGLNIDQATAVKTLDFPELTAVDKECRIYYADSLANMNFPKLQTVTESVTVQGRSSGTQNLLAIDFPALTAIGGNLTLSYLTKAAGVAAPKLESAAALSISSCAALTGIDFRTLKTTASVSISSCAALTGIDFRTLETTASVSISSCAALTEVDFRALETTASVSISGCATLTQADFRALKTVSGLLSFSTVNALAALSFPALETAGSLTFSAVAALTSLQLPALKSVAGRAQISTAGQLAELSCPVLETITGELSIQNADALTSLADAFPTLHTLGGRLYLYNLARLTAIKPPALESAGTVYAYGLTSLTEIDLRAISINRLELYGTSMTGLTLTGTGEFPGYLYLGAAPTGSADIPLTVQNIRTVGTLDVYNTAKNINLPWLERVTGQLTVNGANIETINFPNLQAVGYLYFNGLTAVTTCAFPALTTITGSGFFYQMMTYAATTIEFPELQTVTGNITISNPYTNRFFVSTIRFPKLESLTGTLSLSGNSSNRVFSDLSGFSRLTSAAGVTISNFPELKNFEPLKGVIPLADATLWKVSGCGYNPTHQDMADGRYQ